MSDTAEHLLHERRAILSAALPHVPFDGWTSQLIVEAAKAAGYAPEMALRAFPGGPAELIAFHVREADSLMLTALAAQDLAALKIRARIALAIRLRLELQSAHREAIRRALAVMAQPQHAGLAMKSLYRTVDAIWYAIGDRSTDFNFYTKRLLLAGVYSATLLVWLDDKSEDSAETWAFLERRIENVMSIQMARGRVERALERLPNPFRIFNRRV